MMRLKYLALVKDSESSLTLKTRLSIIVTLEILLSVAIGFGADALFNYFLGNKWNVPLVLEFVVVGLIIGILMTRLLSKMFFDPIINLREGMAKVAEGNYGVRLKEKTSSKEIKAVYEGFNMMANELSSTEILRTDFVSSVSHEIKTPINAIEGYSTLLQGGENLDDTQKEYIEKIVYNTKRLSSLTSSILLLSKIENQTIPTNQVLYDLDEQIRQSIVANESQWEKKNIDFDVELEDTNYYGNETLMHHVWDNLISNAIKFNPYGGIVKISLKHYKKNIIFTIADGGPGISEEAQKRIFDKFYQEDRSHKMEGNGLGLPLVKKILNLEDGTISVENLPGGGCQFTVVLKEKKVRK